VARTGSGHILGDETDSVGIPASGGIAIETDIMGRPAPGRSLYTEYTVYRYTYLDSEGGNGSEAAKTRDWWTKGVSVDGGMS